MTPEALAGRPGLAHLPLPLFAAPLGTGGLGLAWREAARTLDAPALVGEALLLAAALAWLGLMALHMLRAHRHPGLLAADLRHPVRSAFAGAVTIALMILAGGLAPYLPAPAARLWLLAATVHCGIAVWTVRGLLLAPREPAALTPPLLLPLVGNILAPVVGAPLGFVALGWMLFGIGLLLWLALQPLLLHRLIIGPVLPPRLRPTVAILLAPPAVGSLALAALTGGFGPGPLSLLGFAGFLALVLATLAPGLARLPFGIAWWAYTFPTAALAAALLAAARAHPAPWQAPLLWAALLGASAALAGVAAGTVREAVGGRLLLRDE